MDILERIIENLTSDEVRRFKILSNRFKADEEKKLLVLFDAIRSGNYKEIEEKVITQFYGDASPKSRNSYYRLRNKLLSNLEKSLLFYHFNYKNSIESYSNLQLAILFRERGLHREAYYNLKKAEKVASSYDQFSVLEVIYDEMVQLAVHYDLDIDGVIERRRQNQKKMEILRANSEVLGMITHQLKRRNYSRSKSQSVIEALEQIKSRLEEHKDMFQSISGRSMILKTVVSLLIQKSAYQELEAYVRNTFKEFELQGFFTKDNHPTRLLMRIWRINSLQKLLWLDEAATEIEALFTDLNRYKKQNFQEFAFHYYRAKVYNLKLLGDLKGANKCLDEAFSQREILQNDLYSVYMLISRADQYFSQQDYAKALAEIQQILSHKGFQMLDEELRYYIHIFEIVNTYEAGLFPKAETRFKSLRKKFRPLLKNPFYAKSKRFTEILMRLNKAAQEGKKVFLKSAYRYFTTDFPQSEIGDNEIILYDIYFRSKLNEEWSYYELLCQEARKAKS